MRTFGFRIFAPDPDREVVALVMMNDEEDALAVLSDKLSMGMEILYIYPEGLVPPTAADLHGLRPGAIILIDPPQDSWMTEQSALTEAEPNR